MATKMKKMTPVVDLGRLLADYVQQSGGNPAAAIGARMANDTLMRIAERACELKDEILLDSLKSICYVGEG